MGMMSCKLCARPSLRVVLFGQSGTNLQHDQTLLLVHMGLAKLAVEEGGQYLHLMLRNCLQVALLLNSSSLCFQLLEPVWLSC